MHYEIPFSAKQYIAKIKEIKPQYVILFLHLKDKVMLPIIGYCKVNRIPVIYWNHGINIKTPNDKVKNAIFHFIHNQCDALITYTPDMRKYFSEKNQKKLFVAYNTLNFTDIDKETVPDKEITKKKYGISENKVILYISRMMPYKRVDLLMDAFADLEDIAVVMVGPGFSKEQQKKVDSHQNLYYLGEKYGSDVNEVYKMGDVFSTPGHIGLAMNEALFWGLPVVLLEGTHAPEIYYMKNGTTGYADKQKIENEAAIAKAEADKQVAITNAEAEAQKTSIAADAQAEANRKLAESLSDTLIDYQKIQKWDGKLPTVSGGNALVSIDPAE